MNRVVFIVSLLALAGCYLAKVPGSAIGFIARSAFFVAVVVIAIKVGG